MCYVVSVFAFGDLIWLVVWVISFGHGSWWCLFLLVIWCLCMGFVGLGFVVLFYLFGWRHRVGCCGGCRLRACGGLLLWFTTVWIV